MAIKGNNQYGDWKTWGPYSARKGKCYYTEDYWWKSGEQVGFYLPNDDLPKQGCNIPAGTEGIYNCGYLQV
jgi:hypothetical protein